MCIFIFYNEKVYVPLSFITRQNVKKVEEHFLYTSYESNALDRLDLSSAQFGYSYLESRLSIFREPCSLQQ